MDIDEVVRPQAKASFTTTDINDITKYPRDLDDGRNTTRITAPWLPPVTGSSSSRKITVSYFDGNGAWCSVMQAFTATMSRLNSEQRETP